MNASHTSPALTRHPAFRGAGLHAARPAGHHQDLVIENLAELAAAGVPGVCGACIADYFARETSAKTTA
jgi:hypothetical protein